MYKRRYYVKTIKKVIVVLILPPFIWRVVIGFFFPPEDSWSSFFWMLVIWEVFIAVLANISQLSGWSLRDWLGLDVLQISNAMEKSTKRTLNGIRDTLPELNRHLERIEVQCIWGILQQGHPVLIEGESGSGKSGIAASIIRLAHEQGIPSLFLDTRNYSSTVSTYSDLEHYVGVKLPLRDCLEKISNQMGDCMLVIDQLDSTLGTPANQVSIELLASVAALDKVKVVAVSCVQDRPEYKSIKGLDFEVITSMPLDRTRLINLVQEMGIINPSETLMTLSENLFNLSLVAELATESKHNQLAEEVALLDKYRTTLEEVDSGELVQEAIDLAYEKLVAGVIDFSLPRTAGKIIQRLQNRGLIIPAGNGLFRFRHEQLMYYLYALSAIEKDVKAIDVLARIAGFHAESVLVWILRIYHHRLIPEIKEYLREGLSGATGLSFYEKAALLDEIHTWSDIDDFPAVLDIVLQALSLDDTLERYFYRHLARSGNPSWFRVLEQRGCFDNPPKPIEHDDSISYPHWYPIWYLASVAPKLPEEFIGVAKDIQTRNTHVMLQLTSASCNIKPVYAVRMVPLVLKWADEGMPVEKDVYSFAIYLASEGQWEAALSLVDLILSPQADRPPGEVKPSLFYFPRAVSKAGRYIVQALLGQEFKSFLEHCPLEILNIVKRNLEKAFEIEGRGDHIGYMILRPAIEPHEQNTGNEIIDLLIDAAVATLDFVVEDTPDQGRLILEEFLEHRYSIFRRLAIHTIWENADIWPDLLINIFTDSKYLDDIEIYHEYWMLMNQTFGSLSTAIQENFIDQLLSRLPLESLEDEGQYHQQRLWVYRRLCAIKDSLPSDKYRDLLAEMVKEYGELDHPSFLSYSRSMVGEVSPITNEELSKMQPEDILAELKRDFPYHRFDEPSQEGLANALKAAIVSSPEHFAPIALQLADPDIPHIYTERALRGFHDVWKEDKAFKWEPVLELCKMVSQTGQETSEGDEPPDMEPGYWMTTYASARNAVIELLSAGVVRDDHAIPSKFLVTVRDILLTLADDTNPSPEYEQEWGHGSPFGVLELSLNVTRGKAVEALLQYALHVARISSKDQEIAEELLPPGSRMEVIVKNKLTEKLDKSIDPSLAVHSLYGKFLPNLHYLDREWLVAHLDDIFPQNSEMSDYWEAAWDGYLFHGDLHEYLYEHLRPYYRYALDQMKLGKPGKAGSELSRGRVARHLAMLYWWGIETLEDVQSLIPLFFDVAPDGIRSGFVTGLEVALRENEPSADSEEWLRAKTLWEVRYRTIGEYAEKGGDKADFVKELGAFTGWTPFIPEDEDFRNFYEMIEAAALASENWDAVRLLEFLETVSTDHAEFVVSLLEKLLKQKREPFFLVSNYDTVRNILVNAVQFSDSNAKSCAVTVINLFGERGDEQYRDLLKIR